MKRPLSYITASLVSDPTENVETGAKYRLAVFNDGYLPIRPIPDPIFPLHGFWLDTMLSFHNP